MIITEIADFKNYYHHLATNTTLSVFVDDLTMAQRDHIKSVLGEELMNYYQTTGPQNGEQTELLNRAKRCMVYFALASNVKKSGALIGNNGARIVWANENRPLKKDEQKEFEEEFTRAAFKYKNEFITYLESLAADWVPADWDDIDWRTTQECKNLRSLWAYTEEHFNKFIKIESRELIDNLSFKMRHLIQGIIKSELGAEFFAVINAEYLDLDFTEANETVVSYLDEILVNWTIGQNIEEGRLKLEDDGFCVCEDEDKAYSKQVGKDMISMGRSLMKDLKTHLNNSASVSVYPAYFGSTAYTDPELGNKRILTNKSTNKTFRFF